MAQSRPTLEEMYLDIARTVAGRSTCNRLQVGCVITNWEMTTVWSVGYNGGARGDSNICDNACEIPGGCGTVHAEMNALIKAPFHQGPLRMFLTHSPCRTCAKGIVNSQVKEVTFAERYRDDEESIRILERVGIKSIHRPHYGSGNMG